MKTLEYPGSQVHSANPSIGVSVRGNRMIDHRRCWQDSEANDSAISESKEGE
jgi:hypothetical protein